jgi:myo-inositol-1(or 4)-monophosphatase
MTATPDISSLLECALSAARAAGEYARENRHRRGEIAQRFAHDVKLKLDAESQHEAEAVIRHRFPSHKILGEESGVFSSGPEPLWIIDPSDGTVTFQHGLPLWSSAVAVRAEGHVLAGAVFLPEMDECYSATAEGPALCNDRKIFPSSVQTLEESLILTGLSKNMELHPYTAEVLEAVARSSQKVRIMGSAAIDICHVACGKADGYIETGIYLWDIAAAGLVAERAGARTEVLEQLDEVRLRFLCTNSHIHDELKSLVMNTIRAYPSRPPA